MEINLKAALFDLDGVVFDTEPQYTDFWGQQCREFHPERPNLENEIKGQTLSQIYEKYFCGSLLKKRPLITERLNDFERHMEYVYITGFTDFIVELRKHNVSTAVVTSSNKMKMEAVYAKRPEFKSLFDEILTAEDFEHSKPDPDCYLKAAARFNADASECIVFEDSFNGLKSGKAAKMCVIGLATTNIACDIAPLSNYVVSDYSNLDYEHCLRLLA